MHCPVTVVAFVLCWEYLSAPDASCRQWMVEKTVIASFLVRLGLRDLKVHRLKRLECFLCTVICVSAFYCWTLYPGCFSSVLNLWKCLFDFTESRLPTGHSRMWYWRPAICALCLYGPRLTTQSTVIHYPLGHSDISSSSAISSNAISSNVI